MLRIRERPHQPGVLVEGPVPVEILAEYEDPFLELVRLLRESAQIEHALMIQYLYCAFSIKPKYAALKGVATPSPKTFLGVAIQEMQHFDLVNRFLVALNAVPYLASQGFPYYADIYPFPLSLERLTRRAAAKFTYVEAPSEVVNPTRPGDPFLAELLSCLGTLRPNRLGSVYRTILRRLDAVIANPPSGLPPLVAHRAAIEKIMFQGEADHFAFFRSVFMGDHPALAGVPGVWSKDPSSPEYPSYPVPENPSALAGSPNEMKGENLVLGRQANLHYWILIQMLAMGYRYQKSSYMTLAIAQMTAPLLQLGQHLAEHGGGVPFDPSGLGEAPATDERRSRMYLFRLCVECRDHALQNRAVLPPIYSFDAIEDAMTELGP